MKLQLSIHNEKLEKFCGSHPVIQECFFTLSQLLKKGRKGGWSVWASLALVLILMPTELVIKQLVRHLLEKKWKPEGSLTRLECSSDEPGSCHVVTFRFPVFMSSWQVIKINEGGWTAVELSSNGSWGICQSHWLTVKSERTWLKWTIRKISA